MKFKHSLFLSIALASSAFATVYPAGILPANNITIQNTHLDQSTAGNQPLYFGTNHAQLTQLGPAPGGNSSMAYAINNAGEVVGESGFPDTAGHLHGTAWGFSGGTQIFDFGTAGGVSSRMWDVSEGGLEVGWFNHPNGAWQAVAAGATLIPFLPGGTHSYALGVREYDGDSWQAVGKSNSSTSAATAFSYRSNGSLVDLGTLSGYAYSEATGINASGQIVGLAQAGNGDVAAVRWATDSNASIQQLDGLVGSVKSEALAINSAGTTVGYSFDSAGKSKGVVWSATASEISSVLGTLGGAESAAGGINDAGTIVGWATTASEQKHATLWDTTGVALDLNSLFTADELAAAQFQYLAEAYDINESGQIVGAGVGSDGLNKAFLIEKGQLMPIPEPTSSVLLGLAGISFLVRRKVK